MQMNPSSYDIMPRSGIGVERRHLPSVERPWRNNCRERIWAGRSPWSCDSQSQYPPTAQTAYKEWERQTHGENDSILKLFIPTISQCVHSIDRKVSWEKNGKQHDRSSNSKLIIFIITNTYYKRWSPTSTQNLPKLNHTNNFMRDFLYCVFLCALLTDLTVL